MKLIDKDSLKEFDMKQQKVDLRSVNTKEKKSSREGRPSFLQRLAILQKGQKRDMQGRFAVGAGGLRRFSNFNFKRALPLILVVSITGGVLVYGSFAAGSKETVTSWYRTCLNREPDQGGLTYWTKEIDAAKEHIWTTADRFMKSGGVTSCPHKDEPKIEKTQTVTPPPAQTVTPQPDTANTGGGTGASSASQLNALVQSFYKSCSYSSVPATANSGFQFWVKELQSKPLQSVWENFRNTSRNNGLRCADTIGGAIPSRGADAGSQNTTTGTKDASHLDTIVRSFYESCAYSSVPTIANSGFQFWITELRTKSVQSVWENFRNTSRKNGVKCPDAIGGVTTDAEEDKKETETSTELNTNQLNAVVQSFYKSCNYSSVPGASSSHFQYWLKRLQSEPQKTVWEAFQNQSRINGLRCADTIGGTIPSAESKQNTAKKQLEDTVASFYRSCSYTKVPDPASSSGFQFWVQELQKSPQDVNSVWARFRHASRATGLRCAESIGGPIETTNGGGTTSGDKQTSENPHHATVVSFYTSCTYTSVPQSTNQGFQFWVKELQSKPLQSVWENFRNTSRKNGLKCANSVGGAIVETNVTTEEKKITQNPYLCNSPYAEIGSGTSDSTGGRKDNCVSAVQFNLAKAHANVKVTGAVDAATATAIRDFQAFFKQQVTGTLTSAQVKSIADIWGEYRTNDTKNPQDKGKEKKEKTGSSDVGGAGFVDVVFIGRGGVSDSQLESVASSFLSHAQSESPLSGYTFAVHIVVSSNEALECGAPQTQQTSDGPMNVVRCPTTGFNRVISEAGVPADYTFIVEPSIARPYASAAAYVGTNTAAEVLVHEFGHLLGLEDEYVSKSGTYTPHAQCFLPIDDWERNAVENGTWTSLGGSWHERFSSLEGIDFHSGCTISEAYRPSAESIMLHNRGGFNSLSQRIIKSNIKQ